MGAGLLGAFLFGLWHVVVGGFVNGNWNAAGFGFALAGVTGVLLWIEASIARRLLPPAATRSRADRAARTRPGGLAGAPGASEPVDDRHRLGERVLGQARRSSTTASLRLPMAASARTLGGTRPDSGRS